MQRGRIFNSIRIPTRAQPKCRRQVCLKQSVKSMKEGQPQGPAVLEGAFFTMVSWGWTCIALLATAPLIVTPAGDTKGSCGLLRSRPRPSLHTEIRGWEDGGGLLRLRGGKTEAGRTWSSRGRWGQKKDMEAAGGGDPATHYEVMQCHLNHW